MKGLLVFFISVFSLGTISAQDVLVTVSDTLVGKYLGQAQAYVNFVKTNGENNLVLIKDMVSLTTSDGLVFNRFELVSGELKMSFQDEITGLEDIPLKDDDREKYLAIADDQNRAASYFLAGGVIGAVGLIATNSSDGAVAFGIISSVGFFGAAVFGLSSQRNILRSLDQK